MKKNKANTIPLLPGQSSYRNHVPGEQDFYYRKATLQYALDAPVDKYKESVEFYQDEIEELTRKMQNPTWRLDMTKPALTHDERKIADKKKRKEDTVLRLKPAWIKHDRQVLRFLAYMQEPVHESPAENSRFRYCQIYFYLEDGTLQIDEPKIENSGIAPQGAYAKRHCIPKADDGGMISMQDLKCGEEIEIYSKKFRIVSCDAFTRWYYEQVGLDAGEEEDCPEDAFREKMRISKERELGLFGVPSAVIKAKEYNAKLLGGGNNNLKLHQFLLNDHKVLRFWCFWDDPTRYGTRMYSVMNYFLADNTVEFTEVQERNSGKHNFPVFYSRGPLPKDPKVSIAPGMMLPEPTHYEPKDFLIASHHGADNPDYVTVYGRKFVLYKCDEFTRQFYKQHLGIDQVDYEIKPPPVETVEFSFPPHTGFGAEEDSLASCLHLRPKPPPKDLVKLMTLSGKIFRFLSSCDNGVPEDVDRRFLIQVYLQDETISVFEKKSRNSGFMEGSFAERATKKSPSGVAYKATDFFVGAEVTINSMKFIILQPDEFTLKYMESNCEQFPFSDLARICLKIKGHVPETAEQAHPDKLLEIFLNAGLDFNDQEMITLVRRFGVDQADEALVNLKALRDFIGS